MSIRVMTAVWDCGLYSGNKLLLLLAMADIAGDDGGDIYPSVATLAQKARIGRRTCQMLQRELVAEGVLIDEGGAAGGRGQTRRYRLDVARLRALAAAAGDAEVGMPATDVSRETVQSLHPLTPERVQPCVHPLDAEEPGERAQPAAPIAGERVQNGAQKGAAAVAPDSSRTVDHQEARAREADREEPAAGPDPATVPGVIALFDRVRAELFGAAQARPWPHAADRVTAERWLRAGATPELLEGVFRRGFMRLRDRGKRPFEALSALDNSVHDALADRAAGGARSTRAGPPAAELPPEQPWYPAFRAAYREWATVGGRKGDPPDADRYRRDWEAAAREGAKRA